MVGVGNAIIGHVVMITDCRIVNGLVFWLMHLGEDSIVLMANNLTFGYLDLFIKNHLLKHIFAIVYKRV